MEFIAAYCKRNTVQNPYILKSNPMQAIRAGHDLLCRCSRGRTPAHIDPYGYHFVGCKFNANAIRLHDNLVHQLVLLFRTLNLFVTLEPIHMFNNIESEDNRRPDILINNPYGGGPRIILDVAVTGVNGQARHSDEDTDQPLRHRFNQKKAKYAQIAQTNGLYFIPAIFSHTGQIHQAIMDLMFNQIKLKLELADPQVQNDKIQGTLRFWVRQLVSSIKQRHAGLF